ncbi:tRNA 5-methylaminomethyl-2-thiouridine biosynthesis bifunctional protein MnmC [Trichinella pseudospiralis]
MKFVQQHLPASIVFNRLDHIKDTNELYNFLQYVVLINFLKRLHCRRADLEHHETNIRQNARHTNRRALQANTPTPMHVHTR